MIVERIWTGNSLRNYNYLIACPDTGEALAIDPLDHGKCLAVAKKNGWRITQILNTHEHHDHTGGNAAVVEATGAKAILPPALWWAITLAPVAATTAALPPVWSWCSWVLRICVICQPFTRAALRHFSWSSGSIASASPVSGQAIR